LNTKPIPKDTTWADYALMRYGEMGTKSKRLADLKRYFDEKRISKEVYEQEKSILESQRWIKDEYHEEAVAMAWETYDKERVLRLAKEAEKGRSEESATPDGILARFLDLIRRMRSAFMGRGWRTSDEIFEQMYGDTFAQRVEAGKILDDWWFRRQHTHDDLAHELLHRLSVLAFQDPCGQHRR